MIKKLGHLRPIYLNSPLWLCAVGATRLVAELDAHFPEQHVLDAMGVVYLQYWLQEGCDEAFTKHLKVLKAHYIEVHGIGSGEKQYVPTLMSRWGLTSQQGMSNLCMMSNAQAAMEPLINVHLEGD